MKIIYYFLFFFGFIVGFFLDVYVVYLTSIIDNFYSLLSKETSLKIIIEELKLFKNMNIFRNKKYYSLKEQIISGLIISSITLLVYYNSIKLNIPLYAIILFLSSVYIMYIGVAVDSKTFYVPDITLIIPAIFFPVYSYYYNNENLQIVLLNIAYGAIFYYILSKILLFIYEKTQKLFIGIADIKILAVMMVVVGIIKTLTILVLASWISLPLFIYYYFKYKYKSIEIGFGFFLYISFFNVLYHYF